MPRNMIPRLITSIPNAGKPQRHKKCTKGPSAWSECGGFDHSLRGMVSTSPTKIAPARVCTWMAYIGGDPADTASSFLSRRDTGGKQRAEPHRKDNIPNTEARAIPAKRCRTHTTRRIDQPIGFQISKTAPRKSPKNHSGSLKQADHKKARIVVSLLLTRCRKQVELAAMTATTAPRPSIRTARR